MLKIGGSRNNLANIYNGTRTTFHYITYEYVMSGDDYDAYDDDGFYFYAGL